MARKPPKNNTQACSVKGCTQPHHARGLCQKHYDEMRKKSRRSSGASARRKLCSVEGCKRTHHARGYCKMHYAKLVKNKKVAADSSRIAPTKPADMPSPDDNEKTFKKKRLDLIRRRHHRLLKKRNTRTS